MSEPTEAQWLEGNYPGAQEEHEATMSDRQCVPLCGASKAYGRFDRWWRHEALCPARVKPEATDG